MKSKKKKSKKNKVNKKNKIILSSVILLIIGIIIVGYFILKNIDTKLGSAALDTENYLTAVEFDGTSDFIMFFSKDKKLSNIIYLNDKSVESLYKKKIERKNIEESTEIIVDSLKNNNAFADNVILVNYGDNEIFAKVSEEFNKEFIIYGVNKQITTGNTTINDKITKLGLTPTNDNSKNLEILYQHSLDIINKHQKSPDTNGDNSNGISEENINDYALNVYNKLITYSTGITNQTKDDMNGIDVTTINATGDYQNELYATDNSWYYIENSKVYAYINFNYNDANYEYCFKGSTAYIKGSC